MLIFEETNKHKKIMIKVGQIIRFKGRRDMSAQNGALAEVFNIIGDGYFIDVKWLSVTEHLRKGQMDGTYQSSDFYLEKDLELSK
jgi:hypothetical protein